MLEKQNYYTLIKYENEFYIVSQMNKFKVNLIGARIFDLCNGSNNKDDIILKLIKKYHLNKEEHSEEILLFIESLKELNIVFERGIN